MKLLAQGLDTAANLLVAVQSPCIPASLNLLSHLSGETGKA
jgi:hypothetical protein